MAPIAKLCFLLLAASTVEGSSSPLGCVESESCSDQAALLQKNVAVAVSGCRGDECKDLHDNCATWAAAGECDANAHWMWPNCPVSCNKCPHCDNGTCQDLDPNCPSWAAAGECDKNPPWMWPNCAVSCDKCPHDTGGGCVDKDPNCQWWASQGECDTNSGWMWEACPVSCDKCPHITANPTTAAPTPAPTLPPTKAPPAPGPATPITAAPTPTTPTPNGPCNGRVDVFQHGDYGGWVAAYTDGSYNKDALVAKGARDNDASSLQVHGDCMAVAYEGPNFDGDWSVEFKPGKYAYAQFTGAGAVNDRMSSLKVMKAPAGTPSTDIPPPDTRRRRRRYWC